MRKFPLNSQFIRVFLSRICQIFLHQLIWSCGFLPFNYLNRVYYIDFLWWRLLHKIPCTVEINPSWSRGVILFLYWIQFASILLRTLHQYSWRILLWGFLLLVASLSSFGNKDFLFSQGDGLGSVTQFLGSLCRCLFFLKCLVEFTSEAIWSWTFLVGKIFDYWFSLLTSCSSIQILHFFLSQFWLIKCFRNLSI